MKLDNRTRVSKWTEALENYETWDRRTQKILCERGMLSGVDAPDV